MNEIVSSVIAFAIGGIAYIAIRVILKNKRKRRTTTEIIEEMWAKMNKQERRNSMTKEDIKNICQIYDNLRRERDAATIAYNSEDMFWEHVLTTYNFSQPSLPDDLDEAAHSYSESNEPLYSPGHRFHWDNDSLFGKQIETAFKAGAEWMAKQIK